MHIRHRRTKLYITEQMWRMLRLILAFLNMDGTKVSIIPINIGFQVVVVHNVG